METETHDSDGRFRFSKFSDQSVACSECGWDGTADVVLDRLAHVAGFECPDCDRMREAN